jgi:hypothetical protein
MKNIEKIGLVLASILLGVLFSLLLAWPIVWLWNFAVAPVFDSIHEITFWQAYCLSLLVSILFRREIKVNNK